MHICPARPKDGMPATHNDRGPEETKREIQEGLQSGESDFYDVSGVSVSLSLCVTVFWHKVLIDLHRGTKGGASMKFNVYFVPKRKN